MVASGDPRVVILSTNGLSVQSRWVAQYPAGRGPLSRSIGIDSDIRDNTILPASGCSSEGDSTRGRRGVYLNVARLYGLHVSPGSVRQICPTHSPIYHSNNLGSQP